MCISPAAGYRQRLRGQKTHGAVFLPTRQEEKGKEDLILLSCGDLWMLLGWYKLHESQRRAEGNRSEATPSSGPSLLGDWSIEGLLSSQVKTQDKPLGSFALGHMDSSSPSRVAAGQAYHWMGAQFFSCSPDMAFWPPKLITWAETGRHKWSTDKAPVQSRGRALLLSPSPTTCQLSGPAASSSQQPEAGDSSEKENEGTKAQEQGP